mgnify:CR=1 FL=1
MTKSQRAGESPIGVNVVEGKSYYWCACGKSSKQPFCDGSHKETEFRPQIFKAEKSGSHFLCACKSTGNTPFCDGSHSN